MNQTIAPIYSTNQFWNTILPKNPSPGPLSVLGKGEIMLKKTMAPVMSKKTPVRSRKELEMIHMIGICGSEKKMQPIELHFLDTS